MPYRRQNFARWWKSLHIISQQITLNLFALRRGTVHVNPNAPVTECAAGLPKDRIVIYSAFPSSSDIIIGVSI